MNNRTLVTEFAATVAAAPDAVAIVDGHRRYGYAELSGWAADVADRLAAAGVRPGDLVGICLSRGAGVVAAVLGVLAAGGAYVPLDPTYPAERLAFMAQDARLAAVVVAEATEHIAPAGPPVVPVGAPTGTGRVLEPAGGSDADPAYVIYTSGSTGRPKGVVVPHSCVLALLAGARDLMDIGPHDTWTLFHSYSFDFSVWELWGPLLCGGRLVCVSDALAFDPVGLRALLVDEQVTVLNMVPSVFRHLLAGQDMSGDSLALRYLIFGGEAVDTEAVRKWSAALPEGRRPAMVNMYGITETTVHVTYRLMTEDDLDWPGPGTLIGTPLPHLAVRLLDEDLRPVPDGEPGEIVVFGTGVADGYLGRPELTAARFPTLPGPDGEPARCFRSGDLASRSGPDGGLVYLGRADDQVKVHGYRIELGEIEAALRAATDVRDAVVALDHGVDGDPTLVAFVVLSTDGGDQRSVLRVLRAELRQVLPRHLVPGPIEVVDALPRTASGKLDRRALLQRRAEAAR